MGGVLNLRPITLPAKICLLGSVQFQRKRIPSFCQLSREEAGPAPWGLWKGPQQKVVLTFFLSACPFFRSLFAMITPVRRVSNTGSLRLAAASGNWRRKITGEAEKSLEERDLLSKGEVGLGRQMCVCVCVQDQGTVSWAYQVINL